MIGRAVDLFHPAYRLQLTDRRLLVPICPNHNNMKGKVGLIEGVNAMTVTEAYAEKVREIYLIHLKGTGKSEIRIPACHRQFDGTLRVCFDFKA